MFLKKNTSNEAIKNENMSNKELAEKLTNQLLTKFKKKSTTI